MKQESVLKQLFELILKGEVSLWVGAGLSINAGYPSGNGLRNKFWESLNWKEKQLIFPTLSKENCIEKRDQIDLPNLAEKILDIDARNRERLNLTLKSVFGGRTPKSRIHEILGKLPYFKTVITTNYDRLLEKNFVEDKISIIRESKDLTKSKARKIKIIKLHGDLSIIKKIILAESDYSNLYFSSKSDHLWSLINQEVALNNFLFLGYGYSDPNVKAIFDNLDQKIKGHGRKKFLVAPKWSELEQKMLGNRDVQYIDLYGEVFIAKLYEYVKAKSLLQIDIGDTSLDDIHSLLEAHHLDYKLNSNLGKRSLASIKNIKGPTVSNFHLKFKDPQEFESFKKWNENEINSNQFEFDLNEIIDANFEVEGFTLLNRENLAQLIVLRTPSYHGLVSIAFPKEDFEFEDLEVKIFPYKKDGYKLIFEKYDSALELYVEEVRGNYIKYRISFLPSKVIKSIDKQLNWYKLLTYFCQGEEFIVHSERSSEGIFFNGNPMDINEFNSSMKMFQAISNIQKYFRIKFGLISYEEILKEYPKIERLNLLIQYSYYKVKPMPTITIPYDELGGSKDKLIKALRTGFKNDIGILGFEQSENPIKVYGKIFNLGKGQVLVEGPTLELDDEENKILVIKCLKEEVMYRFEKFGLIKFPHKYSLDF